MNMPNLKSIPAEPPDRPPVREHLHRPGDANRGSTSEFSKGWLQRFAIAGSLFAALLVPPAESQQRHTTLQRGDLLAGGRTFSAIGTAAGRFDWFLPTGELNLRLSDAWDVFPSEIAVDRRLRSYWLAAWAILVYDGAGRRLQNVPGFPAFPAGISFDRTGNAYIVAGARITKLSPSGTPIASFVVPYEPPAIVRGLDLASDQCTMFYTAGGKRVFRYDVCNGMPLPDLSSDVPGDYGPNKLRILPDGGVLVTNERTVLRLSESGEVTQVYDLSGEDGWRAIALDVDHTSFWATSGDEAFKFDIESGALVASFRSPDYAFWSIAVVGEPRAALTGESITASSEWSLLALALSLAAVAVLRLRTAAG